MKRLILALTLFTAGCVTPQAVKDSNLAQAKIYAQVSDSVRKILIETPPGDAALEDARKKSLANLADRDAQFTALSIYVGAYLAIPGCEEQVEKLIARIEEALHEFRSTP